MNGRYRNTGAPIPRADGTFWGREEVQVPTDQELRQCAYKLELVGTGTAPEAAETTVELVESDGKPALAAWPMSITPERYLSMAPDGEHAELAIAHIQASGKEFYPRPRRKKA